MSPPSCTICAFVTMMVPLCTMRAESKFKIRAMSCNVTPFNTVKGVAVPTYCSSNVLKVSNAPRTVRLSTVIEAGKLAAVDGVIPTAFQFWFVISTDWELFGRTPSDQYGSSQKPLLGLVQLLMVWPEAVGRDRTNVKNRQAATVPRILGSCIAGLIAHGNPYGTIGVKTGVEFGCPLL